METKEAVELLKSGNALVSKGIMWMGFPSVENKAKEIAALIERQAKELETERIVVTGITETMRQMQAELRMQDQYAELGRLAVEAIDKVDQYTEEKRYTTLPCSYESPCRRDWYREGTMHPTQCPKCNWQKFCKKRAELDGDSR